MTPEPMTHEIMIIFSHGSMTFQANLAYDNPWPAEHDNLESYFSYELSKTYPTAITVDVIKLD